MALTSSSSSSSYFLVQHDWSDCFKSIAWCPSSRGPRVNASVGTGRIICGCVVGVCVGVRYYYRWLTPTIQAPAPLPTLTIVSATTGGTGYCQQIGLRVAFCWRTGLGKQHPRLWSLLVGGDLTNAGLFLPAGFASGRAA